MKLNDLQNSQNHQQQHSASQSQSPVKSNNQQSNINMKYQKLKNLRNNNDSQSSSQERNLQASELYYAQNSQSPLKTQQSKQTIQSNGSQQQLSRIDLRQSNLDSRIMLAQQTGQPFLLETISSNESRFTSSPNFLARSKESFNPTHFANGGGMGYQQNIMMHGGVRESSGTIGTGNSLVFNGTQGINVNGIQDFNNLGQYQKNSGYGMGQNNTQIINVPTLNMNRNQFESISYSASSEFGQHSLRSSVEQQNSQRGFQHLADQIRLEQYQVKNYQNPMTILEESKEEDISFNKTITDQSPIPVRVRDGPSGAYGAYGQNLTGTGGVYFDNKSSIDDGTRSLLMHMRGVPGLESQDHSGTLGSQALRNTSLLGGPAIAGNAKPNFNISSGSTNAQGNFLKFMGTSTPQKSSTQFLNGQKLTGKIQDQELLDELGKATLYDPKASTQQQLMSSLQVSEEPIMLSSTTDQNFVRDDFNVIDQINSARQDGLMSSSNGLNSEVKNRSQERLDASQIGTQNNFNGQYQHTYQTFKNTNQKQQVPRNDPIRIDDNQFVTLNQIPEGELGGYYCGSRNNQQFYSGRPSNLSQYGGNYANQNMLGGGTFSDGNSSSNPTSHMNTPYQNYQSRMISPYPFSRREISGSQLSQKCQCCQAPLQSQGSQHNRPLSGLSQIETKDLNYYDKTANNEVQTPQLASEVDQSTKILSHNNQGSDINSSYKAILCQECQTKMLNKDNMTPIAPSDLKASEFTNSNILVKSHFQNNFDDLKINSNLSSIHQGHNNLANSSIQHYNNYQNNPSQLNNLKFTSSVMGQSELQNSYLTQSNNNQNQNPNSYQGQNSYLQQNNNSNNLYNQHMQSQGAPLQVNSLLQNSESITNPTLQSSSLHYLSYLSQNLGSQLKQSDQTLTQKYGLNTQDNYKLALKSYMTRQFEKSASQSANDSQGGSVQYSRIFRERQTKRMFDQLQNIKGEYAKSYEELEAMHTGLLLGKLNILK